MSSTLGDVLAALEHLYPPATAMEWDRVGLVTGDLEQPVRLVHFAVDPTRAVIEDAVRAGADLLVTHHPLLLRGVHSIATTTAKGYAVTSAARAGLAIYCAHTNADVALPGVSDALAVACGLLAVEPLRGSGGLGASGVLGDPVSAGVGRVGVLPAPATLHDFVSTLAAALPRTAGGVRAAGPPDALVQRVAVVGGAGDDLLDEVRRCGADVFVTADLRHHPALEAREEARGGPPFLVDAGHWASEWLWLAVAARELRAAHGVTVDTSISALRTEPWDFVVGANAAGGVS